jgi:hypothetical protein
MATTGLSVIIGGADAAAGDDVDAVWLAFVSHILAISRETLALAPLAPLAPLALALARRSLRCW